jgi:hypothetical protein
MLSLTLPSAHEMDCRYPMLFGSMLVAKMKPVNKPLSTISLRNKKFGSPNMFVE